MYYVQGMMEIIQQQETEHTKIGRLNRELNSDFLLAGKRANHYTTEDIPTSCVQIGLITLLVTDKLCKIIILCSVMASTSARQADRGF